MLGTERLAHNSVLIKKLGVNERAQVQNDHKFEVHLFDFFIIFLFI